MSVSAAFAHYLLHPPTRQIPLLAIAWWAALMGSTSWAQPATERFTKQYDLIYQIRDVARSAASKSSIGSGFQISSDGLIVTNFHVVSGYVNAPDSRRLEYLDQEGNSGPLELLDFDVINDLALLQHPAPQPKHFALASKPLVA